MFFLYLPVTAKTWAKTLHCGCCVTYANTNRNSTSLRQSHRVTRIPDTASHSALPLVTSSNLVRATFFGPYLFATCQLMTYSLHPRLPHGRYDSSGVQYPGDPPYGKHNATARQSVFHFSRRQPTGWSRILPRRFASGHSFFPAFFRATSHTYSGHFATQRLQTPRRLANHFCVRCHFIQYLLSFLIRSFGVLRFDAFHAMATDESSSTPL